MKHRLPESVVRRFWKYVDKKGPDECWEWIGSRMVHGGYGQLNDRGKLLKAHRISIEIHEGEIPEGMFACHRCNNPPCVNPSHLYAGTPADNWNDTVKAHGLRPPSNGPKGETHHSSKLSDDDVKFVRNSKLTLKILGHFFDVSISAISNARRSNRCLTTP